MSDDDVARSLGYRRATPPKATPTEGPPWPRVPKPWEVVAGAIMGMPVDVPNSKMVRPHCGEKGYVATHPERRKQAFGPKQPVTVASCSNCGNTWSFER